MNNNFLHAIQLTMTILTLVFVTSCAAPLVVIEAPIEQSKNLNDYDSDGVIEAREQCANTMLGASIDNYGCGTQIPLEEPFNIDVKFANNSYEIPRSAYGKIEALANFLKRYNDLNVVIEGHTSNGGDKTLNQILSENRAKAVSQLLINNFNIDQQRVSSVGYGFDQLMNTDNTASAHATNRRIMAEVNKVKQIDNMKWTIYSVNQSL